MISGQRENEPCKLVQLDHDQTCGTQAKGGPNVGQQTGGKQANSMPENGMKTNGISESGLWDIGVRVTAERKIVQYERGELGAQEDVIAVEFPLTIRLNKQEFATVLCTPTDLHDFVVGFLAAEGVIRQYEEIESIDIDTDSGFAYVELKNKQPIRTDDYSRRFIGSCCGKSRQFYFRNDVKTAKTVTSRTKITASQAIRLMRLLQESSADFKQTGGVHNAALCSAHELIAVRTDIGRHNTLDKLYGFWLQHPLPLYDKVIAFSGRISSEVLLKTAKIGIGILLSKSAPTDLALKLADDLGITAVGFIRGDRFNIYSHPERIIGQ